MAGWIQVWRLALRYSPSEPRPPAVCPEKIGGQTMAKKDAKSNPTASSQPTLDPCPFCGSVDVKFQPMGEHNYSVICAGCDAEITVPPDDIRAALHRVALDLVAAKWNRRQ